MKDKITCIIPAYNEEKSVGNVIKIIQNHPLIREVIVVNDGSSDNTEKVVKKFKKIRLISHRKNKGKTLSLLDGISKSNGNILMFIDSDLVGLSSEDITHLARPVIKKEADISISLRKNSLGIFKLLGIDFVSGERVLHKKFLGDIAEFRNLSNFGFESFLNRKIIEDKLRIKIVNWKNVSHLRKSEKRGFLKGNWEDFLMFLQIVKTIGIFGIIKQNVKMRSLRV